jgi:hypothetical protein
MPNFLMQVFIRHQHKNQISIKSQFLTRVKTTRCSKLISKCALLEDKKFRDAAGVPPGGRSFQIPTFFSLVFSSS